MRDEDLRLLQRRAEAGDLDAHAAGCRAEIRMAPLATLAVTEAGQVLELVGDRWVPTPVEALCAPGPPGGVSVGQGP